MVERRFVPLTARTKAALPAAALGGANVVIAGVGVLVGYTIKATKLDRLLPAVEAVVRPGDITPTEIVAGVDKFDTGTIAVS